MLSRATWRDSEKSSTLRSKSVLSLMQNWAAASLMVSCDKRAAHVNPESPTLSPLHHQERPIQRMLALNKPRNFLSLEGGTYSLTRASFISGGGLRQHRAEQLGSLLTRLPLQLMEAKQQLGLGVCGELEWPRGQWSRV